MKKRVLSFLLAMVMVFSILPMNILAADRDENADQVHVIVENTTFLEPVDDVTPAWTGTLVDTWVNLTEESTMMNCIVAALDEFGYTQTGAEQNYISEINGLSAFDGGSQSGWMGTLNDWFTDQGFGAYTVKDGSLEAGDEIRIMYTSNGFGADLGNDWGSSDTSLKALTFSEGTLEPEFEGKTLEYTLTIPAETEKIMVTPTATAKCFKTHTVVGETEYKRTALIPVEDGTVVTITVGEADIDTVTTYTVRVSKEEPAAPDYTFGTAGTVLLPGEYELPISMMDAAEPEKPAAAASCILGGSMLVQEDGSAVITMNLGAASAEDVTGWSANWRIFNEFGVTSDTTACQVVSEDAEGHATAVSFKLPFADQDGVYAAMDLAGAEASNVFLKLDFANAGKVVPVVPDAYLGVDVGSEVPESFENDLWTQYDFKELAVGDTATITPRRVPEAVVDGIGNDVQMPHFNYEIISGDSVVLEGENNLHQGVRAVKAGNTVVKITYDAFVHTNGNTNFPACDPINTQYVIFSVGGNSAITIEDNICAASVEEAPAGKILYRSYDTKYFKDGQTVSFPLTVETTGAEKLVVKCNGITVPETEGQYLLPLENRNNIIEMTAIAADGTTRSFFRVLAARKVEINVRNTSNPDAPLVVGDTANISFRGVKMPVYKLATIYNPQWHSNWGGTTTYSTNVNYMYDGTKYRGECGQYDLATNNDFDVKFIRTGTQTFTDGHIDSSWWGSALGTDKGTDEPGSPNLDAPTLGGTFCWMPDFSVEVGSPLQAESITLNQTELTLDIGDTAELTATVLPEGCVDRISWSSDNDQVVTVEDGKLTAVASGTAVVTAFVETNPQIKATCTVKVISSDDLAAAEAVIKKIEAIGKPADSIMEITAARKAYDALTKEQKALVTNYDVLTAAEEALSKLPHADFDKMFKQTGDLQEKLHLDTVAEGYAGSEWVTIGLARSDRKIADAYYGKLAAFVEEHINDKEQLHRNKSTDNSRVILALTAIGRDVTNVAGHNLLQGLTDMKYLKRQGNNGPIWALIAFDSHDYEIPTVFEGGQQVTREGLIDYILGVQLPDGGWTLSNDSASSADPDMTGMALQALAPYYGKNDKVTEAIDRALETVSEMQLANGGFASWGTVNVESGVQILVALNALGIDTQKDARFIKNGRTILDSIAEYYVDGGGFRHVITQTTPDAMATEQSYYGLASMARLAGGQTALYDMSDVVILPFGDIAYNAWFRQDVKFALDENIMKGTTADTFSPYKGLTRAELVETLYRMSGSQKAEGKLPFNDVTGDKYYADAVLWAYHNGITNGTSATSFSPDAHVSRAQLATFLMRYAAYIKEDVSKRADLGTFKDAGQVPAYAAEAMSWAVSANLVNGTENNKLSPRMEASRAQFAAMIHRFVELVKD